MGVVSGLRPVFGGGFVVDAWPPIVREGDFLEGGVGFVSSGASAAFTRARGACHHAVIVGKVLPAVLAHHYPAKFFVAGTEGAKAFSTFATDCACSHFLFSPGVLWDGWLIKSHPMS